MAGCARCCVHRSMRAMNVIVNLCGIGMIIYALWLEKMWDEGVALLPTEVNLPRPWMDWAKLILQYIDEHHVQFKTFVIFHVKMCRLIVLLTLMLQIIVIVFAVILWAVGTGPRTDEAPDVRSFRQSFLVWPSTPAPVENSQTCQRCSELYSRNPRESFLSYLGGVIRTRFHRTSMNDD